MTLDELIAWVDDSMRHLPAGASKERLSHVRRIHRMLEQGGNVWEFRSDWHALALKVAKLCKTSAPPPATSRGRKQPRRRWVEDELPPLDSDEGPEAWSGRASKRQPKRQSKRRLARQEEREPFQINAELQSAFDAVAAGKAIVFVTGGAGTGKSTFIRQLRKRFPEKRSVVLAPTGVAALNAQGQTIHSFCKLPLRPVEPTDAKLDDENEELLNALDLVIVDEVSMVRADVLDGMDAFFRLNRGSDGPFGGLQVVLVGDLFQLPPVVTERDRAAISARYPTPHFFSAHCLRGRKFRPVQLEVVYRQRDESFVELLAKIRDGIGAADAVRKLNERCVGRELRGEFLTLVPTRRAADAENAARLAALQGKEMTWEAQRDGTFEKMPDDRLPAPAALTLKPGAQVMFLRNDYPQKRWVNGTLGVVMRQEEELIQVRVADGATHEVETMEWQDVRYALDPKSKKVVEEVVGTFTQFPLMPAWAVTIHKAQGLTLSQVRVDLDRGAFADGQVYVALSRCRSLEGLSLRRPVRAYEVRCDEAARGFYQKVRSRAARISSSEGAGGL